MPNKGRPPEDNDHKLRHVDVLIAQQKTNVEVSKPRCNRLILQSLAQPERWCEVLSCKILEKRLGSDDGWIKLAVADLIVDKLIPRKVTEGKY